MTLNGQKMACLRSCDFIIYRSISYTLSAVYTQSFLQIEDIHHETLALFAVALGIELMVGVVVISEKSNYSLSPFRWQILSFLVENPSFRHFFLKIVNISQSCL